MRSTVIFRLPSSCCDLGFLAQRFSLQIFVGITATFQSTFMSGSFKNIPAPSKDTVVSNLYKTQILTDVLISTTKSALRIDMMESIKSCSELSPALYFRI